MPRIFCGFIYAYALAITVVAIGAWLFALDPGIRKAEVWSELGTVPSAYIVLALGYFFSKGPDRDPSRLWLIAFFGMIVSGLAGQLVPLGFLQKTDFVESPGETWAVLILLLIISTFVVVGSAISVWLYSALRVEKGIFRTGWCRRLALFAWTGSSGLILSSLRLTTIHHNYFGLAPGISATGREIVLRKAPWETAYSNLAYSSWLYEVFQPGGYFFYIATLALTLAMTVWQFVSRFSIARMQRSRLLAIFAAIFTFIMFWMYNDLFWARLRFDRQVNWIELLATILWFSAPLFALVLLVPVARGKRNAWRWRAILMTQLPLAAFYYNVRMFDIFDLALGQVAFMVGLQLESWACIGLLILRQEAQSATVGVA